MLNLTFTEVQGAYKLSEDFAKPYFHKYWTWCYCHLREECLQFHSDLNEHLPAMGWSCSGHRQHLLHLATPVTRPNSVWFFPVGLRQGQCLRPTTSKYTTRIARAHQKHNQERHTRHTWGGLAGMGVLPGHLPCHTRGAHRMHLWSIWKCKHSSFKW